MTEQPNFDALTAHEAKTFAIRLFNGNTALISALMDMVYQFFIENPDGTFRHTFISAEEQAIQVLIEAGYAEEVPGKGYRLFLDKIEARQQVQIPRLTWEQAVTMCVTDEDERKRLLAMS